MLLPLKKRTAASPENGGNTLEKGIFLLETMIFGFDVEFFFGDVYISPDLRREVGKYNIFGGMFGHVEMQFSVLVGNDPSFWCHVINAISMVHPLGEWFASFDFVYCVVP